MNKHQKQHKSIVPGNANAVSVVDRDLNFALRTFKRKMKDSNILDRIKSNKTFIKPSIKRRDQLNRAKYIQQIRDTNNY
jgi:small subunit ribosomal protein S21